MKFLSLNPYRYAIAWRNNRFDTGATVAQQASVPIVSVGNISTGGTGKTPFVRWLTALYRSNGTVPAVVSRGYGRTTKEALLVGNEGNALVSPDESGDEPALHTLDGNIVVVAGQRIEGCNIAIRNGAKVCIIDDGFQHRQLRRDIDIVLIDRETIHGSLLPFGRLREPFASLKRAHVVALHEHVSEQEAATLLLNPNSLVIRYTIKASAPYLAAYNSGTLSAESMSSGFAESPVVAVCGIAKPERFIASAEQAGFTIAQKITFPDHVRYTTAKVRTILDTCAASGATQILTTEKDVVKLIRHYSEFTSQVIKIMVIPVQIVITAGEEDLISLLLALVP